MKLRPIVDTARRRVQRFLAKLRGKPGWVFGTVGDLRQQAKVDYPMPNLIWSLLLGLLTNQPTLRDVEDFVPGLGPWARKLVGNPASDTCLDTELRRMDYKGLHNCLVLQVRSSFRSKMLGPVGLPCGVVTVDGKNLATLKHNANRTGHRRTTDDKRWRAKRPKGSKAGKPYWLMLALRATLTSAEDKPCIYQWRIPPGKGESTQFPGLVDALHGAYGRSGMFGIIDGDSAFTSLGNANHVEGLGYGYVFALKGDQPELFAEAKALLLPRAGSEDPEAETPWELRNGDWIQRRLWRTGEMKGIENSVGQWHHLRQTWLVRQVTRKPDGTTEEEDRFFITSVLWNQLKPEQILRLVRNHWGIENDTYNSLDLQWREDHGPWCTKGVSVWALGVLRLMAYNVAQLLRKRRLRRKHPDGRWRDPVRWRKLFADIRGALEADLATEQQAVAPG